MRRCDIVFDRTQEGSQTLHTHGPWRRSAQGSLCGVWRGIQPQGSSVIVLES
jgi:hypothetical protein